MKSINNALLKAQTNIGAASKDAENPFFKSNYADLATVMEVVKGPLNDAGLAITQSVGFTFEGDVFVDTLTTTLYHTDGEQISSTARIPPSKDIQKFGAAISYMKRYALQAMLFVPTADDDGEGAMNRKSKKAFEKVSMSNVPF
tara:strand:- start:105 stop:536 length:432 start_codon:yes stop_codon:yes gene_type:complete